MLDFISNLGTFCSGLQRELKAIVAESARERAVSSASDDGIAPLGCKAGALACAAPLVPPRASCTECLRLRRGFAWRARHLQPVRGSQRL